MKVGDMVKIQVFKGDTAIKRALVLKVDADLIKVAINSEGCSNMTTWLHKEHVKVISHGK